MFIPGLPADEGAELQVQCYGGTSQLGGDHVKCVSGEEFDYNDETKPDCRETG